MLLRHIKRYPFSLTIIVVVIYLSFFHPLSVKIPLFKGFDKLAHFFMYAGVSGCLWLEIFFNHKNGVLNIRRALIAAVISPILFSGAIELLQQYATKHRGGEWLDFVANTCGVIIASLIAWFIFKPLIIKSNSQKS
ncbi:MAG: VanZ family protein [Prevotellaceae bacterium]|jgi:VanZ family protein|nr:VanZ family protein [Prevotellaceae bacterium]